MEDVEGLVRERHPRLPAKRKGGWEGCYHASLAMTAGIEFFRNLLERSLIDLFDIFDRENPGRTGEKPLFLMGFHGPSWNLRPVGNV